MAFYDIFESLCAENEVTPTQVARDNEIKQSVVAMWKKRDSTPKAETVQKLADYFGVSVDYLLGKEVEKHASTKSGSITVDRVRLNSGDVCYEMTLDPEKMSVSELQMLVDVFTRASEKYGFGMEALAQLTEASARAVASLRQPTPAPSEGKDTTAPEPPPESP